jgi:hypothetical protein
VKSLVSVVGFSRVFYHLFWRGHLNVCLFDARNFECRLRFLEKKSQTEVWTFLYLTSHNFSKISTQDQFRLKFLLRNPCQVTLDIITYSIWKPKIPGESVFVYLWPWPSVRELSIVQCQRVHAAVANTWLHQTQIIEKMHWPFVHHVIDARETCG